MYLNLWKEMKHSRVTINDIAALLHIHRNTASGKIDGKTPFTVEEALTVRNARFPDMSIEYLFKRYHDE